MPWCVSERTAVAFRLPSDDVSFSQILIEHSAFTVSLPSIHHPHPLFHRFPRLKAPHTTTDMAKHKSTPHPPLSGYCNSTNAKRGADLTGLGMPAT